MAETITPEQVQWFFTKITELETRIQQLEGNPVISFAATCNPNYTSVPATITLDSAPVKGCPFDEPVYNPDQKTSQTDP